MGTAMSGGGLRRRGGRIGPLLAAVGVAVALTGTLLTSSAGAATSQPAPQRAEPAVRTVSQARLTERLAAAVASDRAPAAAERAGKARDAARNATAAGRATTALVGGAETNSGASGKVGALVIGGTTTTVSSAPWMAQLWYYDANTGDGFFCGGAVVSPTKILTAAHCVKGYKWAAHGVVVTGATKLPDANGTTTGQVSPVLRQWSHPSYKNLDNDIAVLTLANPVKAKPIRMTTAGDTASYTAGTKGKVYGWGRYSSLSEDISGTLRTATMPIQADSKCRAYYGAEYVKGHMVCVGTPATGSDTGTVSACNGDSGGPLVVKDRIVGVVSWGVEDCVEAGAHSVFTKVTTYVGAAWAAIDDANLSYEDNKADLFVRKASTKVGYEKDSKGTSFGARQSLGKFTGVNLVLQTDLDGDSVQDLVYRRSDNGHVYWSYYDWTSGWRTKKIFSNWKTRTRIVTPGDLTGDYKADLISVDKAGKAWLYPGKGNGTFASRVRIGSGTGWNGYNMVRGKGDLTGDGRADILARHRKTGAIYLYKGTGKASSPFSARVKVRTWKNSTYNAFDAVGDVNGDGKADFLARTPGGRLYLYKGTGKANSKIFAERKSVGTDFKQYDIFG